jgi:hypothetical protein
LVNIDSHPDRRPRRMPPVDATWIVSAGPQAEYGQWLRSFATSLLLLSPE